MKEVGEDQANNYWTGWWAKDTANLKKKLNIEKHGAIGGLDLPEGRELKEDLISQRPSATSLRRPLTDLNFVQRARTVLTKSLAFAFIGSSLRSQLPSITRSLLQADGLAFLHTFAAWRQPYFIGLSRTGSESDWCSNVSGTIEINSNNAIHKTI